ncbi:hypothetical protein GG496_000712 [Candidatus Fervidibacteria bacterium JGI MDM2 JNZ-1-D12]
MPRKKKLAQLPAQIYNLGSAAGEMIDFSREELWSRMDAPMGAKAVSIPVFLVNEAQMDEIYPPERRRALDPERVRALMREWEEMGGWEDLFEQLEKNTEETWWRYKKVVAVGVYISGHRSYDATVVVGLGNKEYCSVDAESAFLNLKTPAIFLCPERIVNRASREGITIELVLDKVYYHELGHAIMDRGNTPYDTVWGRTIEESLANWIAYSKFKGSEARLIQRLISTQPAEYQGYAWLSEVVGFTPIIAFIRREREIEWVEWLHFIRWHLSHGFPLPFPWGVWLLPEEFVMQSWIKCKRLDSYPQVWKEIAAMLLERV